MLKMGVQHSDQCGPLDYDTDPSVTMPMNPALMALGTTEEPLQIQVVRRSIGDLFTDE
jgi:hypothetical protein